MATAKQLITLIKPLRDSGMSIDDITERLQKDKVTAPRGKIVGRHTIGYYCAMTPGLRKHTYKRARYSTVETAKVSFVSGDSFKNLAKVILGCKLPDTEKLLMLDLALAAK